MMGLVAWLLAMSMACTQQKPPCLQPTIASLNIECVHFPTDTSTTTVDTALPAGAFGALPGGNVVKVTTFPRSALFTISLASDSNACSWVFSTDSMYTFPADTLAAGVQPYDTLRFQYQRNLNFLSNACGYTYFYTLTSVTTTHHLIDSIVVANNSVTNNVNTRQLKIFIHPDY
jgi:predicted nucleic-acid-binding Zn-ribbon protein